MLDALNTHQPRIVVIGGGTGLPVILKNLRNRHVDITAIVTVADDGGSSGILRNYINVVPPGDIRNVMVALSEMPELYLDLFQYLLVHFTIIMKTCGKDTYYLMNLQTFGHFYLID